MPRAGENTLPQGRGHNVVSNTKPLASPKNIHTRNIQTEQVVFIHTQTYVHITAANEKVHDFEREQGRVYRGRHWKEEIIKNKNDFKN